MKYSALLLSLFFTALLSFGQSINFDGVNDYVLANSAGPSGTSDRTVECWLRTTNAINTQKVLVDWGSMSPLGSRFTLNLINQGRLRIEIGGNGFNSNQQIADGKWHHVAVTYEHAAVLKARLYIDGQLDTANNFTRAVNTSTTNPIQIARRNDGVNYFQGDIDEVRIWNVARTAAELFADMNNEYCTLPSGLVAYYKCNEGVPGANNSGKTSVRNYANASNNGTLSNSSLNGSSSNWATGAATLNVPLRANILLINGNLMASDSTADRYQWYDCTQMLLLPNDTQRTYLPIRFGDYSVILTKGVCTDTSACFTYNSVGISQHELSQIKAHPNPAQNAFQIELPQEWISQAAQLQLFDMTSKLVYEASWDQVDQIIQLNVSALEDGMYLLHLQSPKGRYANKIIVQH